MRARRTAGLLFGASLVLGGCGSAADKAVYRAQGAVDDAATKLVERRAVGTWRCETDQVEHGEARHLTTEIAIGSEGRFTVEVVDGSGPGPLVGTWRIEDLELRVSVPWADDGRNGLDLWIYYADADPPTHLDGQSANGGVQDLEVGLSKDRLTIHQDDDGGEIGGVAYTWDVTCDRTSIDPGVIPDTVPVSTGAD